MALSRQYFKRNYKGMKELQRNGTEVQVYHTGEKALARLRQLIESEKEEEGPRWKSTHEQDFIKAKEGNAQQAKDRRLDWDKIEEKDDEGRPSIKKGIQRSIEYDFLDMLQAGDITNYDEYKEYVFNKGL